MTPSNSIIEVRGLRKQFGGLKAVGGDTGVSFEVPRGKITGLIGPNGAGKSTTFNLISGVLKPTAGSVFYNGEPLSNKKTSEITAAGLSRTFQTPRSFPTLTVLENVVVGASSPGEWLRTALVGGWRSNEQDTLEKAQLALNTVGLAERANDEVTNLSGGELRMLEVARQLVRDPDVLLLDEPTAGVDPGLQNRLRKLLLDLHEKGTTLVVVEHNLHFLLEIAHQIVVLQNGELLAAGTPQDIKANPKVVSAYLGDEHAA